MIFSPCLCTLPGEARSPLSDVADELCYSEEIAPALRSFDTSDQRGQHTYHL